MKKFYLGCDVSKGYGDFIIMDSEKTIIESNFQLDDTFEGHNFLHNILLDFFEKQTDAILFAAVESTGSLENNWLNLFYRLGQTMNIKATRINPLPINRLYDASLTRNVNDKISAKTIAEYLIIFPEKLIYNQNDPYESLKKQWTFLVMLKKQKTQLLNQLSTHIYTTFPFMVKFCKNGIPNWLFLLLIQYPSASKLSRARKETVAKIPYISRKRAMEIISLAKKSIGSSDDDTTAFLIKSIVKQIVNLKKTIEEQHKHLKINCDLPEIKLLNSFKGIGIISAIGLVININSIERFPSAKHLASYFGIHPVYRQSGDGTSGFRMSKKGRVAPRQILYMVARTSIIHNPLIREIYLDQLKQGKKKMSALGVCMHKILRIVYGMLKTNTNYDSEIDRRNKNRTRSSQILNSDTEDNKRRFQKLDVDAPISRRQNIKRKKRKQSQSLQQTNCGIMPPAS